PRDCCAAWTLDMLPTRSHQMKRFRSWKPTLRRKRNGSVRCASPAFLPTPPLPRGTIKLYGETSCGHGESADFSRELVDLPNLRERCDRANAGCAGAVVLAPSNRWISGISVAAHSVHTGNEWYRGRGGGLAKPSERIRNPSPWARMAGDGSPLLSGR